MSSSHPEQSGNWTHSIARVSFLSLTAILFCSAIYLVRIELHAIILGILLGGILTPMHKRILNLTRRLDHHVRFRIFHAKVPSDDAKRKSYEAKVQTQVRRRAAIFSVILVFLVIVIPVTCFLIQLAKQGVATVRSATAWIEYELPRQVPNAIETINRHELSRKIFHDLQIFTVAADSEENGDALTQLLPLETENPESEAVDEGMPTEEIHENENPEQPLPLSSTQEEASKDNVPMVDSQRVTNFLVTASRNLFTEILKLLVKIISKTWMTVFNFFIMLFVMFFIFYDGENIMNYVRSITPLEPEEQQQVLQRIKEVSSTIAISIFGTACCQAIVAMVIFRIVGIPALFWGVMLGMCSIIPFVGTTLIWIPATIYLLVTGQTWQAFFVLITCAVLVANLDNFLRPFLMKKGGKTGMSYLVLFFAILGGLQTFGLVGIIYGPLIFGICGICLLLFKTQFKRKAP